MFHFPTLLTAMALGAGPQIVADPAAEEARATVRQLAANAQLMAAGSRELGAARTRWRVRVDAAKQRVTDCESKGKAPATKAPAPDDFIAGLTGADVCDVFRQEQAAAEGEVRAEAQAVADRLRASVEPSLTRTEESANRVLGNPAVFKGLMKLSTSNNSGKSTLQLLLNTLQLGARFREELDRLSMLAAAGDLSAALREVQAANSNLAADLPTPGDIDVVDAGGGDALDSSPLSAVGSK